MRRLLLLCLLLLGPAWATDFAVVRPGVPLAFPRDFGAHPAFRTEWWYLTGWLTLPGGKPAGFQVTFFRSRTGIAQDNPSRFAPTQLLFAHAALSDPATGSIRHEQKSARAGLGLAEVAEADTRVHIDDWSLQRQPDGRYRAVIPGRDFRFDLMLDAVQPPLLQGQAGYSRKGSTSEQASYYYSQPQLKVSGTVTCAGKPLTVTGTAWLDHEWSSEYLGKDAVGWDWTGLNLDNGGALMAFRIRNAQGGTYWAGGSLRSPDGRVRVFQPGDLRFVPKRTWLSPHSQSRYPVEMEIAITGQPAETWLLTPLMEDQEVDARASTGGMYWEGAVTAKRNGEPAGRGYLELTGYGQRLRM